MCSSDITCSSISCSVTEIVEEEVKLLFYESDLQKPNLPLK